jgi:NADPH-dependent 2,4-dienoyl-CoA reductase/sulfur reductase-like enzyme/peroxiredoxin family protein/TusA-related sulfurtransferase/rhodanese-related sulfurtransferase
MKLLIIGGVAGGATAAARARRLCEDAQIIVFERGPHVSFANCGLPYHIGGEIAKRDSLLLQTPEGLRERYNLDVRVRTEVVSIDRANRLVHVRDSAAGRTYSESYDKLILAPGAAPVRPPLPGIDHPRIFTLRNIPDTDRIKAVVDAGAKSAVVVGGGYIGLEMAENLRRRGIDVYLVEMLDQVMPPLDREMATAVHQALTANGVKLLLGAAVESFADADGRVRVVLRGDDQKSGSETLPPVDMVILSVGVEPDSRLARDAGLEVTDRGGIRVNERMQTSDPDIYAVGDAVVVKDYVTAADALIPLAGPANRQGRIAADNIFGRGSTYRGSQGTAILRVFDLTVGMTGASEKVLRRDGVDYEKVYIHPADHAGYYPGAAQMSIKLLFAKKDGRVLGAQVTGTRGVDKRVDVIATAIQAGMSVYDLEEAELAYAPPYGAAKDPVNMAGFVAANVLRGDVAVAHADSLEGSFVLDVREPAENAAGAISGSVLIPLGQLRSRHNELPKDKPVVVYCQVGLRGYVAARMLKQLGYDARNLSGGYRTYWAFNAPREGSAHGGQGTAPTNERGETIANPTCCGRAGADPSAADEVLDVREKQCPGPIVAVSKALQTLCEGQVLRVLATDPGFAADIPAWCRATGNELLGVERVNGHYVARLRKIAPVGVTAVAAVAAVNTARSTDKTIVVFSNDLDRAMAAFVIANGAASMGQKVTLFFTFWGLNILRRPDPPRIEKGLLDRMFGWMMPRGAERLTLSKMHMGGMGTAMMKRVMKSKNVDPLPALMGQARLNGVRLVACSMSLDVMGLKREELIDGVEIGGVGTYLGAADAANVNLFI